MPDRVVKCVMFGMNVELTIPPDLQGRDTEQYRRWYKRQWREVRKVQAARGNLQAFRSVRKQKMHTKLYARRVRRYRAALRLEFEQPGASGGLHALDAADIADAMLLARAMDEDLAMEMKP